jgi:hypothetical protein
VADAVATSSDCDRSRLAPIGNMSRPGSLTAERIDASRGCYRGRYSPIRAGGLLRRPTRLSPPTWDDTTASRGYDRRTCAPTRSHARRLHPAVRSASRRTRRHRACGGDVLTCCREPDARRVQGRGPAAREGIIPPLHPVRDRSCWGRCPLSWSRTRARSRGDR